MLSPKDNTSWALMTYKKVLEKLGSTRILHGFDDTPLFSSGKKFKKNEGFL